MRPSQDRWLYRELRLGSSHRTQTDRHADLCHGYYEEGAAAEGEVLIDAWLPGYERTLEALPDLERLGGSHAQRDVFIDLAISSAIRAGGTTEGERLGRERWTRRAGHLDAEWLARLAANALR